MAGRDGKAGGRPKQTSEVSLVSCRQLDRSSAVPLYYQLAATLFENFETAGWPEGARFATERELEEQFGVSRAVVRRALELLVGDGAIHRKKGSGAFVAPRRRPTPVLGLVKALSNARDDVALEILTAREDSPDSAVAHFLGVDVKGTKVAHVTGVIQVEGRSMCLVDSHTLRAHVPWLLPMAIALQDGKTRKPPTGVRIGRSEVLVEHTYFGAWGGPKLGVSAGDPALMARLVQYGHVDGVERPIEFARLIYRSDLSQVAFELN